MARFNRVKIGTIFLTSTGLENGTPCKLDVSGLDGLFATKTGQVTPSADGTPFVQLVDNGKKGIRIQITVESLTQAVFENLISAINAAIADGGTMDLEITGKTGDYSLQVLPLMPKPVSAAKFNNFYIKNTVINLITT